MRLLSGFVFGFAEAAPCRTSLSANASSLRDSVAAGAYRSEGQDFVPKPFDALQRRTDIGLRHALLVGRHTQRSFRRTQRTRQPDTDLCLEPTPTFTCAVSEIILDAVAIRFQ